MYTCGSGQPPNLPWLEEERKKSLGVIAWNWIGSAYPWNRTPGDVVAHGLEIDHRHQRDSGRGQTLVGVRRVRGRQRRDDDHIATHQKSTAEERAAPPDPFHQEYQEEQARDHLDHPEEPRNQQVVVPRPDQLEDLWRVCEDREALVDGTLLDAFER